MVAETSSAAECTRLSPRDEADLRFYFSLDLPPVPGATSNFGSMCARLGGARNRKSKERPTPFVVHPDGTTEGAPWTEILDCARGATGGGGDAEDAFVAYVDARRCVARVRERLEQLTPDDVCVLAAHYGATAEPNRSSAAAAQVEALTPTARSENRRRAAAGQYETIVESILALDRAARGRTESKASRDAARQKRTAIRREAAEAIVRALGAYGRFQLGACRR